MASTYTRILLHLVFSTKNRANLIAEEVEPRLYAYFGGILDNQSSRLLAAGGTANHVHLLVSLGKALTVTALLEALKKDSSKWIKTLAASYADFYWQDGYGAFSIGHPPLKCACSTSP